MEKFLLKWIIGLNNFAIASTDAMCCWGWVILSGLVIWSLKTDFKDYTKIEKRPLYITLAILIIVFNVSVAFVYGDMVK